MPTLNLEFVIAVLYYKFIQWWPSHEAWVHFQLYFNLIWAIVGLILSVVVGYLAYLLVTLQMSHKQELFEVLVTAWENNLAKKQPEEWLEIVKALDSENVNDWKLAIIKADTILDALTVRMNVMGENLGERLKNLSTSELRNLDEAWEAHKVRNQIAHDGDYVLSKYEARRVITLFERVFRELGYI